MDELKDFKTIDDLVEKIYKLSDVYVKIISENLAKRKRKKTSKYYYKQVDIVLSARTKTCKIFRLYVQQYRRRNENSNEILVGSKIVAAYFYIVNDNILLFKNMLNRSLMAFYKFNRVLKKVNKNIKKIGPYILFDHTKLNIDDFVKIDENLYLFKLPYTRIDSVYVPSKKTFRIFIINTQNIFNEHNSNISWISYDLYKDIIKNEDYESKLVEIIPMLASFYYGTRGITKLNELETKYSEKMIKVLTS